MCNSYEEYYNMLKLDRQADVQMLKFWLLQGKNLLMLSVRVLWQRRCLPHLRVTNSLLPEWWGSLISTLLVHRVVRQSYVSHAEGEVGYPWSSQQSLPPAGLAGPHRSCYHTRQIWLQSVNPIQQKSRRESGSVGRPWILNHCIWVCQVCPASSPPSRSNSPSGGDQLTAQPLSSPECPRHKAWGQMTQLQSRSLTSGLGHPGATCTAGHPYAWTWSLLWTKYQF